LVGTWIGIGGLLFVCSIPPFRNLTDK
jgi:hypothetical protein